MKKDNPQPCEPIRREEKRCCGGLGLMGKCGRGTKRGCPGAHCKCMNIGNTCPNMHYVDCFEHYIHIEHVPPAEPPRPEKHVHDVLTFKKETRQCKECAPLHKEEEWEKDFESVFGGAGRYLTMWNEGMRSFTSNSEEVKGWIRTKKAQWELAAKIELARQIRDVLPELPELVSDAIAKSALTPKQQEDEA